MEVSASAFYTWLKTPEDSEKAQQKSALEATKPGSFSMTISKPMVAGDYPMNWARQA